MVKVACVFPRCSGSLVKIITDPRDISKGVLTGSESLSKTSTRVSRCVRKGCRIYILHTYMRVAGEKIKKLSFSQMKAAGLYLVTSKTAFTMTDLELCYLRFLRAKTSPGQEATVRALFHEGGDDLPDQRTFRDGLLRAVEADAMANRTPDQVVSFNVDYPAKEVVRLSRSGPLIFHPRDGMREVAMDGNFGLHRHLIVAGIDPPRTKQLPGRPRKALREDERSCSCARKGSLHLALPKRTAGWQFAVNSSSRKVLAASGHKATESHGDTSRLLQGLCAPQFVPDVVIHDDACHLEAYVRKHHLDSFP